MTAIFRYVIRCWFIAKQDVALERFDKQKEIWDRERAAQ